MTAEEELKGLKERVLVLCKGGSIHQIGCQGDCVFCKLYRDCAPPAPVDPWELLEEISKFKEARFGENVIHVVSPDFFRRVQDAVAARGEGK